MTETAGPSGFPGSPKARRIVVLRHGETHHNVQGVWQGQLDSELSPRGHEQAKAAAQALSALSPSLVVASDLQRAALTGQDVAAVCGIPLTLDERWREIHVGEWSGMPSASVWEQHPEDMDRLMRGEDFRRGVHGESVADVARRVRAALVDLLAGMSAGDCAVVATHGVAGRTTVAELVGLDHAQAWCILAGLGNCHWAELFEGERGWRIQTWNASA